jgi:hypothetical protein
VEATSPSLTGQSPIRGDKIFQSFLPYPYLEQQCISLAPFTLCVPSSPRMDTTQEQVMEEIDNLSQAMLGMGRRTPLERYASVRSTRSPPSPGNKDLGSSQHSDVRDGRSMPRFQDEVVTRSSELSTSFAEQIKEPPASFAERRLRPMPSQSVMSSSGANEHVIPSTTLRKNIATRRSRGRQDEPARDPKDLVGVMKRSKGRSENQEYRRASLGGGTLPGGSMPIQSQGASGPKYGGPPLPGPEMLRRTKSRLSAEMAYRTNARIASLMGESMAFGENPMRGTHGNAQTPQPSAPSTPFLKRDVPSQQEHSQLHARIMDLMAIRQQFQEQMEEAIVDKDQTLFEYTQQQQVMCNESMHEIVRSYLMDGEKNQSSPPSASRTSSTAAITEDRFVGIDDLPSPSVNLPLERLVRESQRHPDALSDPQVRSITITKFAYNFHMSIRHTGIPFCLFYYQLDHTNPDSISVINIL